MFLRIVPLGSLIIALTLSASNYSNSAVSAQEPKPAGQPPVLAPKPEPTPEAKAPKKAQEKVFDRNSATADQIVEAVILVNGSREVFNQIRRFGLERGKRVLTQSDGRLIDATYELRFKRGETTEKDQTRLDLLKPVPYSMIYANNESWGMLNGTLFSPRPELVKNFQDQMWHGLEPLFRYKEDGSVLTLVGRQKHGGVEVYVIDMVHTAKLRSDANGTPNEIKLTTRYFISVNLLRVLWLEYEDPGASGKAVKYMRRFYDYKVAQGTLVPYRSVLLRDGERVEETNLLTVTYGIKIDEAFFAKS
ncbi:MAG: hypothetical protein ABIP75_11270 [Pyrinomonadaceae bacterium]